MFELVQWKGADGEALPGSWPGDFRKELDELLLRFFGENLPVSAIILAAFDTSGENGNGAKSLEHLDTTAFPKLAAMDSQSLTAMDVVRVLKERDLQALDNFSRVEQAVKSVSNEEALELNQALHETLPWLEERVKQLKFLASTTEERYADLVDYLNI
jgi:hypothetical protein